MNQKTKFFAKLAALYLVFVLCVVWYFDIVATNIMGIKLLLGAGALFVIGFYIADYVYNRFN